MKVIDKTFPTPAENLAFDEVLLNACEEGHGDEVLRFWESPTLFVVLGSSGSVATETYRDACVKAGVPVLRRHSGGGTVLQGPGCLNYALILRIDGAERLAGIAESNTHIMTRNAEALSFLLEGVQVQGYTDLTLHGRKFSGNAQRRRQRCLLFHGTFLNAFPIETIGSLLPVPPRQPAYRKGLPHGSFLVNTGLAPEAITFALSTHWGATEPLEVIPAGEVSVLAREKYSSPAWINRV